MDRREIAGSLGDVGTLVPLAVLLITVNRLNPSVVFGITGFVYLLSGLYYRIPMAVQPLKSFSSLAIALGLGASVIAAGSIVMGVALLILGLSGAADWIAQAIPKSLVRGIQLGVGLILIRVGLGFCAAPLAGVPGWASLALAGGTAGILFFFIDSKRYPAGLLAVAGGLLAGLFLFGIPALSFGPVLPLIRFPKESDFWTASILLVLPQIPLTLANSITATHDVARQYFGEGARKVTGRALTMGLGFANLFAGMVGGMPLCHGSGGITAHYRFGARTGGAGVFLGSFLIALALLFGPAIGGFCGTIPRPVLGTLMAYVGISHCLLIRDVRGGWNWATVLATGVVGGVMNHNAYGLGAGIIVLTAGWFVQASPSIWVKVGMTKKFN
jgi:MFS superfamily sulfate permease-like transporter